MLCLSIFYFYYFEKEYLKPQIFQLKLTCFGSRQCLVKICVSSEELKFSAGTVEYFLRSSLFLFMYLETNGQL